MQVKQYMAIVQSPKIGTKFMVFQTGDPKFYLFDMLDKDGCSTCIQFPIKKADLKREYRGALAHGWGNAEI